MTLNKLTDIFNEYVAVDDYRREDDGLRFWMAARTSNPSIKLSSRAKSGEWMGRFYVFLQHQK